MLCVIVEDVAYLYEFVDATSRAGDVAGKEMIKNDRF